MPFRAGETLTYDVSWSDTLTAGSATLTVRDKRPSLGSTAYYLVAEGRPTSLLSKLYAVYDKVDTLVDIYTLFPQRGSTQAPKPTLRSGGGFAVYRLRAWVPRLGETRPT